MQTNEMELGAPPPPPKKKKKKWIEDGNHQLKQDGSNKNI